MTGPHVYFLRPVGQQGPVKIGYSKYPPSRLLMYLTWSPVELEIAATTPGDIYVEQKLHSIFADQHSHLEWFHASKRLTALIAGVAAGVPLGDLVNLDAAPKPFRKPHKQPPCTDNRRLFLKCSARLRIARNRAREKGVHFFVPDDIQGVMNRWCRRPGRAEITPTPEQLRRIEALLAPYGLHLPRQSTAA